MSDLVGNPEDRFSRVEARIIVDNGPILFVYNLIQRHIVSKNLKCLSIN